MKVFPKLRKIKDPNINLSYCDISIHILYYIMLSMLINVAIMETYVLTLNYAPKDVHLKTNKATNLLPWITSIILITQIYEWSSMKLIIIF